MLCRLTSILVSRYILNLREDHRSHVTSTMAISSRVSQSIQFVASRSADSHLKMGDSFCRNVVDFIQPFGASVGGFLGAGLTGELEEEDETSAPYVLDIEGV